MNDKEREEFDKRVHELLQIPEIRASLMRVMKYLNSIIIERAIKERKNKENNERNQP